MPHSDPGLSMAPLGQRFITSSSRVTVADRELELVHPRSVDDLISQDDFDQDQRLPYWGAIWPSARVLSERIAREPGRGKRLLELGAGVGLVSLAASMAGFDVLATDYYSEALEFIEANARANGLTGIRTQVVDWRSYPPELCDFDFVVASDVLYDRGNNGLVAAAYKHSLAPGGVGLLTDPGRSIAKAFAAECRARALQCDCVDLQQIIDGAMNCVVELFEIRHT